MRGFLFGSLALVMLYVGLQPSSAKQLSGVGGIVQESIRRGLSPSVAGVPLTTAGKQRLQPIERAAGSGGLPSFTTLPTTPGISLGPVTLL